MKDKDTGKPRGFGFLAYEDQRSTVLAVDNLSGARVAGRIIRVEHVDNYKRKRAEVWLPLCLCPPLIGWLRVLPLGWSQCVCTFFPTADGNAAVQVEGREVSPSSAEEEGLEAEPPTTRAGTDAAEPSAGAGELFCLVLGKACRTLTAHGTKAETRLPLAM